MDDVTTTASSSRLMLGDNGGQPVESGTEPRWGAGGRKFAELDPVENCLTKFHRLTPKLGQKC